MNRKQQKYLAIAIMAVAFIALAGNFNFFSGSIWSISDVNIDPQGGSINQNGELTGAYWVVVMSADQVNDVLDAIAFDDSDIPYDAEFDGQQLEVKSTLTFRVDPQRAYYTRQLELLPVNVVPDVYGTSQFSLPPYQWNKLGTSLGNPVSSGHYEWATTPDGLQWKKVTPFSITVLKNGQQVGDVVNFNTNGGSNQISIPTGEGTVIIRNLGMLAGQYSPPDYDQIVYFPQVNKMYEGVSAKNLITSPFPASQNQIVDGQITTGTDTFAAYWFGTSVWEDGMPKASQHSGFDENIISSSSLGGWVNDDDALNWRRLPVKPEIWDKSKLPLDKQKFGSVTDFLDSNGQIINLNLGAGQGYGTITDKTYYLPIPWDAMTYGSPLFQILIPTELADTFIYRPPVSDVKIVSIDQPSTSGGKLFTTYVGSITLRQDSTVESDTELSFQTPSGSPLTINPNPIQIGLKPGETKTIPIYFLNPGNDIDGLTVQVTAITRELFTGTSTDTRTFTVTLGARTEQTVSLTVYTLEAGTGNPLDVQVSVKHIPEDGTQTQQDYTIDGQKTFDLGTYQGQIEATAHSPLENTHYGDSKIVDLNVGVNAVTLLLTPIGSETDWSWILFVGGILAFTVLIYYFIIRKRRH